MNAKAASLIGLVAKCVNVRFAHQKLSSCKVGDIDAAPSIVLA
jgi:hypothetical protein